MRCPHCSSEDVGCIDSRLNAADARRRRYTCHSCNSRFSTIEVIADSKSIRKGKLAEAEYVRIATLAQKFAREVLGGNNGKL